MRGILTLVTLSVLLPVAFADGIDAGRPERIAGSVTVVHAINGRVDCTEEGTLALEVGGGLSANVSTRRVAEVAPKAVDLPQTPGSVSVPRVLPDTVDVPTLPRGVDVPQVVPDRIDLPVTPPEEIDLSALPDEVPEAVPRTIELPDVPSGVDVPQVVPERVELPVAPPEEIEVPDESVPSSVTLPQPLPDELTLPVQVPNAGIPIEMHGVGDAVVQSGCGAFAVGFDVEKEGGRHLLTALAPYEGSGSAEGDRVVFFLRNVATNEQWFVYGERLTRV